MESSKATIADLFESDRFYQIPDFQRPFSWNADQFNDLISDLLSADWDKEYFLGTIVYYLDKGSRAVVDGQQRLTSLMVLLACIRDQFQDTAYKIDIQKLIVQPEDLVREIPERDRLSVKDHDIYRELVVTQAGTLSEYDVRDYDEPESRYIIARDIYIKKLSGLGQQELAKFLKFVSNRCLMIYLQANTFEEAFRLFEVVNDRGKQLRRIDLLKSHNLSREYVPQEAKRKQLASQWEQDESSLGETEFESIFNIMRLIYVKDKPQTDLFTEYKNRIFHPGLLTRGEPFFAKVTTFVDLYRQIFVDRNYLSGDQNEKVFAALIFIMDEELRTFEWRACVLAFAQKFGRRGFYSFLLNLEKVVLDHLVNGIRKDERYASFVDILKKIDAENDPEKVTKAVFADASQIQTKLETDDVYKRNYAKYVLLRLELGSAEHAEVRTFSARSIEHVFPQTPETGGQWDSLATKDERGKFVHRLGNLVLLSKGKNSAASNKEFDEKKKSYLAPRVSDYPRSNQVCSHATWDKTVIDARTKEAARLVLKDPAVR